MTIYKTFNFGGKRNPMSNFTAILGLLLFLVLIYLIFKSVYAVLSFVGPGLLLLAAILDYTVITDYAKYIFGLLKENPLFGLVVIFFSILGYPFLFGYLFIKALGRRKIKKYIKNMEDEKSRYDDFEEVKEEKEDDFLVLPKMEKPIEIKKQQEGNEYEDLFKS